MTDEARTILVDSFVDAALGRNRQLLRMVSSKA